MASGHTKMDKFLVYTTANTNDTETYKHKRRRRRRRRKKTGNKTRQTEVINLELQAIYPKRDSEEEEGEGKF